MSGPTKACAARMASLKLWQLKYWAFLTGRSVSGTKPLLQENAFQHLEQLNRADTRSKRIVSVDMGIRNLAFCVVDMPAPTESPAERIYNIRSWKRMDVTQPGLKEPEAVSWTKPPGEVLRESSKVKGKQATTVSRNDNFSPGALAKTAVSLTQDLASYNADTILIERQRFRTAGRAAVSEWTLRVNMLEHMLWACFESRLAFKNDRLVHNPSVIAISPSRVARFWAAHDQLSLDPPTDLFLAGLIADKKAFDNMTSSSKMDKRVKVKLVRHWLSGKSSVRLAFSEQAGKIAKLFGEDGRGPEKLDDLADCLLQAISYAKWEENARVIQILWEHSVEELNNSGKLKQT